MKPLGLKFLILTKKWRVVAPILIYVFSNPKLGPDTKVLTVGGEYRSLEKGNEFKCLLLQTLGNSI